LIRLAPIIALLKQLSTDGRLLCGHCQEAITAHDTRAPFDAHLPLHYECGIRMALGSLAHVERRCSCYVDGSEAGDPEGVTRRQAARLVYAAVRLRQQRGKAIV